MHQTACTPPPTKGAAPAVVAPSVPRVGVCTIRPVSSWYSAHDLAKHFVSHDWPFMAGAASSGRACGGSAAAAGLSAAARSIIPDGNHGDNTVEVAK